MKGKIRQPKRKSAPQASARLPVREELAAVERQVAEMLRNIRLIAVLLDRRGRVVYANEFLLELTGYTRAEVIGGDWFDRFVPSARPDVKKEFLRSLRRGDIAPQFENPIRGKNGELHDIAWNNTALHSPAGAVIGTASIGEDVGARRRMEAEIRKTLESIGDGFYACDADWRFVYVNTQAERILNIRREEVLGRNHWEVFPLATGTNLEREYRRAAAGEIRDFENFYEPWQRWFHNRCYPREGGGMSVYFQDITARKRMEAELRQSRGELRALLAHLEQAREAERARIARDIHDDFGQSLTAIKMDLRQIERLARQVPPAPPAAVVERAAGAIELVDNSLATVQELAAQLRPGILDRLGLGPALQYEARRFQERHGIRCSVIVPAALTGLPPDVATALFRIFQECLTNVARHAGASRVVAVQKLAASSLWLRVRDNGVGISQEALANPASLGLIGIRERATSLGGEVSFRRGRKGGTVVEVRLPLRTWRGGFGDPGE